MTTEAIPERQAIKPVVWLTVLVIAVVGIIVICLTAKPTEQSNLGAAMENCQQKVRGRLQYPSSAGFSALQAESKQTAGEFVIQQDFTAKNGFGAELPYRYVCVTNDAGTVTSLEVSPN